MDGTTGRVTHNISLGAVESHALVWLVRKRFDIRPTDPLPRGVVSWLIQEWIGERMRSEIGRDWESALTGQPEPEEAVA